MPAVVSSIPWQSGAAIVTAMGCRHFSRRSSKSSTAAGLFVVVVVFFADLLTAAGAAAIDEDAAALLAFKAALNRADRLSSWNNTSDVCSSWHGVTCSGGGTAAEGNRVTKLRVPGKALLGSIAAGTLGKLSAIQILSLRNNFFTGSLPPDLVNCTSLRQIVITNNNFSGPLPSNATLAAWQHLQTLDVSNNSFSGGIPPSIDGLPKLRRLLLQHNLLEGSIPALATIAPALKSFSVADNRLSGSIPSSLQKFGADSFTGNADLCGPPLPSALCPSPPPSTSPPVPQSPSPSPSPSPPPSSGGLRAGAIAAIVVCSVAFAAAILLGAFLLLWARRRRRQQRALPTVSKKEDLFAEGREEFYRRMMRRNSSRGVTAAPPRTKSAERAKQSFDLNDLLRASAEILGKGSLGTVYKVEMENGKVVCVKRLRRRNGPTPVVEAAAAAESEETALGRRILENLCSLSHPNLVPVRAHFIDQNEKLVITDYIPHHSLGALLHGSKGRKTAPPLEWRRRLGVAGGAAKGLVFLHSRKVVHGSIKSTNLLLMGGDGEAMWSDYGLLPVAAAGGVSANGYTPPEAILDPAKINYKGDVYSFGILLLEILTAKLPAVLLQKGGILLPQWVQSQPNLEDALDRNLMKKRRRPQEDEDEVEEMLCLLRIAMSCVVASPDRRPHMVEIVKQIVDLQNRATGILSEFL